jgi:hypothetical protein
LPDLVPTDDKTRHERLRIARDLHDTVAQRLAGLGFALDAAIADEFIPSDRKRSLRQARLELSTIVQELRDEILALRSDGESSIESWLRERLALNFIWQRIESASLDADQSDQTRYILLELLRNAITYRGVSELLIEERSLSITVDYLSSTPVATGDATTGGIGRVGIHERIRATRAELVESEKGFMLRWH